MTTLKTLATTLLCFFTLLLTSQNVPTSLSYDGMLWTSNDTFHVNGSTWDEPWHMVTTGEDTVDLGTDGFEGVFITVWTDRDTLVIPYVNYPNDQWLFIPVGSPRDTTMYRLRFNGNSAIYSPDYVRQHKGGTGFQIPETYELANIILYLSDCSVSTGNHPENGAYVDRVRRHFGAYRNHPLVRMLNDYCADGKQWNPYYGFRENSICFAFDEQNRLQYHTPYKTVRWDDSDMEGGLFRKLLYLVQDFSDKTGFREFYRQNAAYYRQLEKRQHQLLPVERMWTWLEREFPQRFDSYRVVFSPLIVGTHSTQQFFKGYFKKPEFRECLMFINSPESIDARAEYSEKLKQGLMSGIVFTEIDHNYVNDATREHFEAVKKLMHNKNFWATESVQQNYRGEFAIFNEYMTHALFCLYISETYPAQIAQQVIDNRIALMVDRRGFTQFRKFNELFLQAMKGRKKTVYASYGDLIEVMKRIGG